MGSYLQAAFWGLIIRDTSLGLPVSPLLSGSKVEWRLLAQVEEG